MSDLDPAPLPSTSAGRSRTATAGARGAAAAAGTSAAASGGGGGQGRGPSNRSGLRGLWTALIAILAVSAGILLVNLLNGPDDDDAEPLATLPPVTTSASAPASTSAATMPGTQASATAATSPAATASSSPSAAASTPAAPTTRPPTSGGNGAATAAVVILNNSNCQRLAENTAKPKVEAARFTVVRTDSYYKNGTYQQFTTVFYEDDSLKAAAENLQRLVPGIKVVRKIDPDYLIRPDDEHGDLLLVITKEFATDSGVPCDPS